MLRLFIGVLALLIPNILYACDGPYAGQKLTRQLVINLIDDEPLPNLCGANLKNANLSNLNLAGIDLSHALLEGANLDGSDLSRANLAYVQLSNAQLAKTYFRWANLSHANLSGSNLESANFVEADLSYANIRGALLDKSAFNSANLSHATFTLTKGSAQFNYAQMTGAQFNLARLPNSTFEKANASGASFIEALLTGANFSYANLTDANFQHSNLSQANFTQTLLTRTDFEQADLDQVLYFPSLDGLPSLNALTTAKHFDTMQFYDPKSNSAAMSLLQVAYKNAGIINMERQITSMRKQAHMRAQLQGSGFEQIEGMLNYIFFYMTCDFGLAPGRLIVIFFSIIIVLSIPYYLSFGAHSPHAGIIVAWPSRREPNYILEASYQHFIKIHPHDPWVVRLIKRYRRVLTAFYFSCLSSVRLGWQDFNLANWISLVQTKEYTFIARGWVRSLAGLQSIVSAYLLVLWALTYFGNPFVW